MIAQDLRFLLLYPVNVAVGLAWFVLFWRRWKHEGKRINQQSICNGEGNFWAALLGLSIVFQAGSGILSLWLRELNVARWGDFASWLFSAGVLSIAVVVVAGTTALIWKEWRNGGK